MSTLLPRRRFLAGASALATGLALPAASEAPQAPSSASTARGGLKVAGLELLTFRREVKGALVQRRVLQLNSNRGHFGQADLSDLDYLPVLVAAARECLVGRDATAVERVALELRAFDVLCSLRGCLEYALWDLLGKDAGLPVFRLLGGPVRDRLRVYRYGWGGANPPSWEDYARRVAEGALKLGYDAFKIDTVLDHEKRHGAARTFRDGKASGALTEECLVAQETAFRIMREVVGDRCDIILGTHGQMSAPGAIELGRRLARFDVAWFEEPVHHTASMDDMAAVARGQPIPVATGENLVGLEDFGRLLEKSAAAFLNVNPANVGGLVEMRKIAILAEARGVQLAPHFYAYQPTNWLAAAHLCMAVPNVYILEANQVREMGAQPVFFRETIRAEGSYFVPGERPGLGHVYDDQWLVSREVLL